MCSVERTPPAEMVFMVLEAEHCCVGGMAQQDGFRADRAPYFVVPPVGPINLPIPARHGGTPRAQPQQNGMPFGRSRCSSSVPSSLNDPRP